MRGCVKFCLAPRNWVAVLDLKAKRHLVLGLGVITEPENIFAGHKRRYTRRDLACRRSLLRGTVTVSRSEASPRGSFLQRWPLIFVVVSRT